MKRVKCPSPLICLLSVHPRTEYSRKKTITRQGFRKAQHMQKKPRKHTATRTAREAKEPKLRHPKRRNLPSSPASPNTARIQEQGRSAHPMSSSTYVGPQHHENMSEMLRIVCVRGGEAGDVFNQLY